MKGIFTFFLLATSINSVVSESNDINLKIKAIRIVVKSDDLMKFDKSSINVEKNKPYEIILKNVGKLPKAAMGHNLIILDTGNDALTFGGNLITKYGATLQNEWKPIKAGKLVLAQTKMLGPNEQDTIKITFKKVGVYHDLFPFPGHFGPMRGVINVKYRFKYLL